MWRWTAVAAPVGTETTAGTRPDTGTVGRRPGTGTVDRRRPGTAAGTAAGTEARIAVGTAAGTAADMVRRARSTAAPAGTRAEPPGYCTAVVPHRRADNSAGTMVRPRGRRKRAWAAVFATGMVAPHRHRTKIYRVFPAWPFRRPSSPQRPQR